MTHLFSKNARSVLAITLGLLACMVLTAATARAAGTVLVLGSNLDGQKNIPFGLTNVVGIAAGHGHSAVVLQNGRVLAWGLNDQGQTNVPAGLSGVVAVAAGTFHTLALLQNGTVVAWGWNAYGQTAVPAGLSGVKAIAAGHAFSVALLEDGSVVTWGQSSVPVGLTDVISIAAGSYHIAALKADGKVVAWGRNVYGEGSVPTQLEGVIAIAAGGEHNLAVKQDGSVAAWGRNLEGQCNVPAGLSGVVSIAAGGSFLGGGGFSLALKGDGSVTAWGVMSLPAGLSDVEAIAAGTAHALALVKPMLIKFGTPELRADGEPVVNSDVVRGDQSTISLFTMFPNGTIFYTTDGSQPDFTSTAYLAPFVVTQTTTIRIIAYNIDFTEAIENGPFLVRILPTYTLTKYAAGYFGGVAADPELPRYVSGTVVRLAARRNPLARFLYWGGDACGSESNAVVVMDGNKTAVAFLQAATYRLTTSTHGGGAISGGGSQFIYEGTIVNLTAVAEPGWQFLRWEGDSSGDSPTIAVTMDQTRDIQAVFGTTLSTIVSGAGTLVVNPSMGVYPYGTPLQILARPSVGFYFSTWGSAGSGRVNPLELTMTNSSPVLSALFTPLRGSEVNVYANVEGGGLASVSPGLPPYISGTQVTLTATALPGWRFAEWRGDVTGFSSAMTVVLATNTIVTAVFQPLPRHSLIATTAGGGRILGNSEPSFPENSIVDLTAQPLSGWQFLRWQGDAAGTSPVISIPMDRAKTVEAVFGTAVSINAVGKGTVTAQPAEERYPYGSVIRITATPNAGSSFGGWGNAASGTDNPLDFLVTNVNVDICASFLPGSITTPPSIIGHPSAQSLIAGGTAVLRVTAVGASPFTYQWRKNGVPISGATGSTYAIVAATANEAGDFDVIVSNAFGSTTSSVATVTVVFPPSITAQPSGSLITSGTPVILTVGANGTAPLRYEWRNDGVAIPGATNVTYSFPAAVTNNGVNYSVVVANSYGAVTSQVATFTVYTPVAITRHPSQQLVPFRGTATFTVQADGYPAPQFQWLFNGNPITGANQSSLVITNLGTNALGGYSVIASNAYSTATSGTAALIMAPSIRTPFLGATIVWGKEATLSASAIGSGELSYQWYKNGVPLAFANSPTLVIPAVQLDDGGLYSLVVRSAYGSVTNAPAQVIVNPANISLAMFAGVTIEGVAGFTYGVQFTTDLRDTNSWINATNLTLTQPIQVWVDLDSATGVKRFYRVIAR